MGSTDVLLPSASVDIFTLSKKTAKTANTFIDDWRFARVELFIDTDGGGIDAAIERYSSNASPELVIIETDDISEDFIEQLGSLAGNCVEGTDAIIIGPTNDVHLYRDLIGMGIRDYLVRPVSEEDLSAVIADTLISKKGLSDSRLVAVVGSKGGVGTTTVAQTLAWEIAVDLKQKTMLTDGSGGWGTLGIAFGVEANATLDEAVRTINSGSEEDIERLYHDYGEHLFLLPTGGDKMLAEPVSSDDFEKMIDKIMLTFPVVIVDLSGTSPDIKKRILSRAHETVLVTTPTLPALRGARSLLSEVIEMRGNPQGIDLVVNMEGQASAQEVQGEDIKTSLNFEPNVVVAFDPKIFLSSEADGKLVVEDKKIGEKIGRSFIKIARQSANQKENQEKEEEGKKNSSLLGKILGKG